MYDIISVCGENFVYWSDARFKVSLTCEELFTAVAMTIKLINYHIKCTFFLPLALHTQPLPMTDYCRTFSKKKSGKFDDYVAMFRIMMMMKRRSPMRSPLFVDIGAREGVGEVVGCPLLHYYDDDDDNDDNNDDDDYDFDDNDIMIMI